MNNILRERDKSYNLFVYTKTRINLPLVIEIEEFNVSLTAKEHIYKMWKRV